MFREAKGGGEVKNENVARNAKYVTLGNHNTYTKRLSAYACILTTNGRRNVGQNKETKSRKLRRARSILWKNDTTPLAVCVLAMLHFCLTTTMPHVCPSLPIQEGLNKEQGKAEAHVQARPKRHTGSRLGNGGLLRDQDLDVPHNHDAATAARSPVRPSLSCGTYL